MGAGGTRQGFRKKPVESLFVRRESGNRRAWQLAIALVSLGFGLPTWASGDSRVLKDLAYAEAGGPTLDLYLPSTSRPPLLVFIHSRFWSRHDRARELSREFARPLQRAGAAVAVVRHRSDASHPAPVRDAAQAFDFLLSRTDANEFDRDRVFVGGHDSGAHLASWLALDPRILAAVGREPNTIAGVAAFSGYYELDPPPGTVPSEALTLFASAFPNAAERHAASLMPLVRHDAPPFLVLTPQNTPAWMRNAGHAFAKALRTSGHPLAESLPVSGRDHWSVLDLREPGEARQHLWMLLGIDETYGSLEDVYNTRRYWREPKLSTQAFWDHAAVIDTREVNASLLTTLNLLFASPTNPQPLRPTRYSAIDLRTYLERAVPGDGEYITLTNARGEQVVWKLSEVAEYEPEIVVGLDRQRELFELVTFYHTRRQYTWRDTAETRRVMARPIGAFVHFRKPAPPEIDPKLVARFALLPTSFARSQTDPREPLRDLAANDHALITSTFQCVACHQFRGIGARAGHLLARDGSVVPGFALPLEEYSPAVWKRYCFEQPTVAAEIGATPVPLSPDQSRQLFELVERERANR